MCACMTRDAGVYEFVQACVSQVAGGVRAIADVSVNSICVAAAAASCGGLYVCAICIQVCVLALRSFHSSIIIKYACLSHHEMRLIQPSMVDPVING